MSKLMVLYQNCVWSCTGGLFLHHIPCSVGSAYQLVALNLFLINTYNQSIAYRIEEWFKDVGGTVYLH